MQYALLWERTRTARLYYVLIGLATGCSVSSGDSSSEKIALSASHVLRKSAHASWTPGAIEVDLGPVLASGQTIRRKVTLKNPTNRPIRLAGATAYKPCCSEIGPVPDLIPPYSSAEVPIVFKPGNQSGPKRVEFGVETDLREQPVWLIALSARLFAESELETLNGSDRNVPIGRPGTRRFRVISRRKGNEGLPAPEGVQGTGPIEAVFRGAAVETAETDGLREAVRELEVVLLPSKRVGPQRGTVVVRWPDGRTFPYSIDWDVTPHLRASPSGLVIHSSPGPASVTMVVEADDRPFRVTKVTSPLLVDTFRVPAKASRTHKLRLTLDPSRAVEGSPTEIKIVTDHPDQPTVAVTLLVLSAAKEEAP